MDPLEHLEERWPSDLIDHEMPDSPVVRVSIDGEELSMPLGQVVTSAIRAVLLTFEDKSEVDYFSVIEPNSDSKDSDAYRSHLLCIALVREHTGATLDQLADELGYADNTALSRVLKHKALPLAIAYGTRYKPAIEHFKMLLAGDVSDHKELQIAPPKPATTADEKRLFLSARAGSSRSITKLQEQYGQLIDELIEALPPDISATDSQLIAERTLADSINSFDLSSPIPFEQTVKEAIVAKLTRFKEISEVVSGHSMNEYLKEIVDLEETSHAELEEEKPHIDSEVLKSIVDGAIEYIRSIRKTTSQTVGGVTVSKGPSRGLIKQLENAISSNVSNRVFYSAAAKKAELYDFEITELPTAKAALLLANMLSPNKKTKEAANKIKRTLRSSGYIPGI